MGMERRFLSPSSWRGKGGRAGGRFLGGGKVYVFFEFITEYYECHDVLKETWKKKKQ